jgi:lipoate-protein ligase A
MVSYKKSWRFLSQPFINELNFNLAVDEAVLRCVQEGLSGSALRLWRGSPSIILSKSDKISEKELIKWRSLGLNIARSCVNGRVIYNDEGVLNIALASNELRDKLNFKRSHELIYEVASFPILKLGLKPFINEDSRLILANNKILASISSFSFYDSNLIFAVLYVNSNLSVMKKALSDNFSSIENEAKVKVDLNEVEVMVKSRFEELFNAFLIKEKLNEKEEKTAKRLYEIKYSRDEWVTKGEEPLTLKDVLVEIYIAYPPTTLDRKFIEVVNKATSNLNDKVEVRIWMRGRGIPPGVTLTSGLRKASKESIIPALIINGELKLGRITAIPSENELRNILEEALKGKN